MAVVPLPLPSIPPSKVDPSTYDDVLQNTLVISSVDRTHHASLFECRAINNNVTDPPT